MLDDHDLIAKHAENLFAGSDGITYALLVMNEKTGEGILVNSEGSSYARYSAYLPFAKPYLDYEIARIADYCVTEGTDNTSDGLWTITFDEIREHFGIDVFNDNGMQEMILDRLRIRDEVAEIVATEDEFEIKYGIDFCPPIPELKYEYEEVCQDEIDVAAAKHMLWIHDIPGGEQANFSCKQFLNVDFSGYKFNGAIFKDSLFENCKFKTADLCFADFTGAVFEGCDMTYIAADELNMKGAFLEKCDLSYFIGCHCNFADAKFSQCSFFNGMTSNCCFENTVFYRTETDDSWVYPDESITEYQWREDNGMNSEQEMQ